MSDICSTSLLNVITQNVFAMFILIKTRPTSKYDEFYTRRNSSNIITQILKETNATVEKTQFMHKCSLNYSQLQIYLEAMLEMKLLARKIDNNCREKSVMTHKRDVFAKGISFSSSQNDMILYKKIDGINDGGIFGTKKKTKNSYFK